MGLQMNFDIAVHYQYPLGLMAFIFVMVLMVSLEVGFQIGKRVACHDDIKRESKDIALGSMLALLGLVIAFTYAYAISRADHKKEAVQNEANAIGTAFLRAELAAEPFQSELRQLLLGYARTRVTTSETISSEENIRQAITRSLEVQSRLWPTTVRMVQADIPGPVEVSIVQAINNVLDRHSERVALMSDHLPTIALLMLVFIAAASVTVAGYNAGLSGSLNRWRMTTFTLVLAAVLSIIIDFDVPQRGFISTSQNNMVDLIHEMEVALEIPASNISHVPRSVQPH